MSLLAPPERKGLALGLVGLVRVLPIVVFSLFSGVVADALDRRRLMLLTQIGHGAAGGRRSRWLTFARPGARLADLRAGGARVGRRRVRRAGAPGADPNLVPREHLPNAISLNTIMFQVASVVGPSLGGIVIARVGVGWAYALNAAVVPRRDRRRCC